MLNVEADHLDFFKDLDDIIHSFRAFCQLTPANGLVVVNADDDNAMQSGHRAWIVRIMHLRYRTGRRMCVRQMCTLNNGYYSV